MAEKPNDGEEADEYSVYFLHSYCDGFRYVGQRKGQRRESAAGGVGSVSERIGWLPFAGLSGWARPSTGPFLNRTAVRHNKVVIRISASPIVSVIF